MENKLQRGDWAPPFKTIDIKGEDFDFANVADWGIWLAFYRYSSCPMCNQHFDDVVGQQIRLLENRVLFVAVFESELKNFPKSIVARDFPNVKIIADPGHKLYELYGVEQSWAKLFTPQSAIERVRAGVAGYKEGTIDGPLNRIPAHFLILPQGMIHQAKYGRSAADHIKWRDLDDFYDCVRGQISQVNRPIPQFPAEPQIPDPLDRRQPVAWTDPNADEKTMVVDPQSAGAKTPDLNPPPPPEPVAAPLPAPAAAPETNSGYSRTLVLDPDSEETRDFELDGDAPTRREDG